MEVRGQLHDPAAISQRKEPRFPLNRNQGWSEAEDEIFLSLEEIASRNVQHVAYSLHQLSYLWSFALRIIPVQNSRYPVIMKHQVIKAYGAMEV
jgi:hypothetical protein